MALTPEDVVNKRFQPTKFREGYDQDEVDDFLDEVVVELRRLGQENEELRQRLVASDARISELQRSGAGASPAAAPAAAPVSEAPAAAMPEAAPTQAYVAGVDPASDPNNTNNLLQLARRLHEEHVREGIEKRDALIAEGHAAAARIVSEAEAQQRAELDTLDQERTALERRVEELRQFEREYRAKLKGHIEGLLHDLDATAVPTDAAAPAAQPEPAVTYDSVPSQAMPPQAVPSQPPASFQGFGGN
jgi:DivIVA domain-containing protein